MATSIEQIAHEVQQMVREEAFARQAIFGEAGVLQYVPETEPQTEQVQSTAEQGWTIPFIQSIIRDAYRSLPFAMTETQEIVAVNADRKKPAVHYFRRGNVAQLAEMICIQAKSAVDADGKRLMVDLDLGRAESLALRALSQITGIPAEILPERALAVAEVPKFEGHGETLMKAAQHSPLPWLRPDGNR